MNLELDSFNHVGCHLQFHMKLELDNMHHVGCHLQVHNLFHHVGFVCIGIVACDVLLQTTNANPCQRNVHNMFTITYHRTPCQ
jgi:hypothetical protein